MTFAETAVRHSRAAALVTLALLAAGVIAACPLPSSIYPPLSSRASWSRPERHTAGPSMTLTVTRPLEQA